MHCEVRTSEIAATELVKYSDSSRFKSLHLTYVTRFPHLLSNELSD